MPTGSSNCFDINRSFAENSPNDNTESPFFPFLKGRRSSQVHFYLGLSSLSELLLSPDQCRIEAQPAPRAPLNQHVCIVPTKRNVCALNKKSLEAIVGGEGVGALEEPLPLFSVPCRKGSVSRSWHLPGCGGFEEAVMSAILRWTLQWALCRHLFALISPLLRASVVSATQRRKLFIKSDVKGGVSQMLFWVYLPVIHLGCRWEHWYSEGSIRRQVGGWQGTHRIASARKAFTMASQDEKPPDRGGSFVACSAVIFLPSGPVNRSNTGAGGGGRGP